VVIVVGVLLARRCREPDAPPPPPARASQGTPAPRVAERAARTRTTGLRLEGLVLDHDAPVGGVTVLLLAPPRQVVSEQDGSFAFDGLTAGSYTLAATGEEVFAEDREVSLSATSEPVVLHVRPAGALAVTVLDADSGKPIAGATVSDGRRELATDAAGHARLRGLHPDRLVELEVGAPEHGAVHLRVPARGERTVSLERGAPVSGTVVAPDGALVANATVELEGKTWRGEAKSDGRGRWRVPALARGSYSITASSERYTEAEDITVKLDGAHPRDGVIVPVAAGGEIDGRVTDEDDHPIAGAKVRADSGSFEPLFATTDDAGRFHMQGMPLGTYQVWAATGGQASMRGTALLIEAGKVEMQLTVRASTLSGIVVDRNGPVADAKVTARSDLTVIEARTDAEGRFDLGGVPLGAYTLWAGRTGWESPPVTAQAGDHTVTLTIFGSRN
jgi:hypothetical protein